MNPVETALAVLLAAAATAVATGYVRVPYELTHSSIGIAGLLIFALVLYSYSPVVGIAAVILFAVLLFSRNVEKVVKYTELADLTRSASNPRRGEYGDMNIANERNRVHPYTSSTSGPRDYSSFRETTPSGIFGSGAFAEGFLSGAPFSSFASEQYAVGQFPIDENRNWSNPYVEEYKFRPSLDTGDNDFKRYGPEMDQKLTAVAYH